MSFQPGNFRLKASPLALVLVQFSVSVAIDLTAETLRECLKTCGLEKLTKKFERNVTVNPTSPAPVVQDRTVCILLDSDGDSGISVVDNTFAYFTNKHETYDDLANTLSKLIECIESAARPISITSVALRYVNAFRIAKHHTEVVSDSLGGLSRNGLVKEHHHHNYEFWCETDDGRLHTRFATDHGDRKPKQLGHSEQVYPHRAIWSYEQSIGHLDIFETSNNMVQSPIDWPTASMMLKRMNLNIEQAFLNAVKEDAMVNQFGAEAKS